MRVLFLSRANAARGPMAMALARHMFPPDVTVDSAGIEKSGAGKTDPRAIESMKEINLDITGHQPKIVKEGDLANQDLVVIVCERDVAGTLPIGVKKLHWPIMDPTDPPAPEAEMKTRFRDTRMALAKHLKAIGKLKKGG